MLLCTDALWLTHLTSLCRFTRVMYTVNVQLPQVKEKIVEIDYIIYLFTYQSIYLLAFCPNDVFCLFTLTRINWNHCIFSFSTQMSFRSSVSGACGVSLSLHRFKDRVLVFQKKFCVAPGTRTPVGAGRTHESKVAVHCVNHFNTPLRPLLPQIKRKWGQAD